MKIIVTNYTFNAAAKTITFTDYNPVVLERVLLITNVTDGIVIYNFCDPTKGGSVSTNVLTLEYNTAQMSNSDSLQIYYYDPTILQVDSELPAATALADGESDTQVVPRIGAIVQAKRNDGTANVDRATLAKLKNLHTGGSTEYVLAVNLATGGAAGSIEVGTQGSPLYIRPTDGTNNMPMMDAVGRRGYQTITDGTNSMPTMDAVARRGFITKTDGTAELLESTEATLLASASRTTTQTGADITNYSGYKYLHVVLDMTDVTASPSVTLTIEGKDVASGKYYTILAGAAVTTAVTNVYRVGPGITPAANATTDYTLPRVWRIVVTANNANAGTYSVGYSLTK